MKQADITPEVAAAAQPLTADDWLIEEGLYCGTCGESFAEGQQALHVVSPFTTAGGRAMVEDIHLRCYQGEEVRR